MKYLKGVAWQCEDFAKFESRLICYLEHDMLVCKRGCVLEQESEGEKEVAARLTVPGALMRGSGSAPAASSASTLGVFPSMAAAYSGEQPSCDRGAERTHRSARATQRQHCSNTVIGDEWHIINQTCAQIINQEFK